MYLLYLLYQYKSTHTDAALLAGGTSPGLSADALAQRDLKLTGTKVQILTRSSPSKASKLSINLKVQARVVVIFCKLQDSRRYWYLRTSKASKLSISAVATGYKQQQASDKAAAIVKRLSQEKLPVFVLLY